MAVRKHIDYYDALESGQQVALRKLIDSYPTTDEADLIHPDDISSDQTLMEGFRKQVTVNAYGRSPIARQICLAEYGYQCQVCEFGFEKIYGDLGRCFIHVHHVVDVSTRSEAYEVDQIQDLRPVCPNCHAMLHRKRPAYSREELRALLNGAQR